jgi:hypothetical protein
MKEYLENSLNYYLENDEEDKFLAIMDACLEYFKIEEEK